MHRTENLKNSLPIPFFYYSHLPVEGVEYPNTRVSNIAEAILATVDGGTFLDKNDDIYFERGACGRLFHHLNRLQRFYASWHGAICTPVSRLWDKFIPATHESSKTHTGGLRTIIAPKKNTYNLAEQLFRRILDVHNARRSELAELAIGKLMEIDPTFKRLLRPYRDLMAEAAEGGAALKTLQRARIGTASLSLTALRLTVRETLRELAHYTYNLPKAQAITLPMKPFEGNSRDQEVTRGLFSRDMRPPAPIQSAIGLDHAHGRMHSIMCNSRYLTQCLKDIGQKEGFTVKDYPWDKVQKEDWPRDPQVVWTSQQVIVPGRVKEEEYTDRRNHLKALMRAMPNCFNTARNHPDHDAILGRFNRHCAALKDLQGSPWQVLRSNISFEGGNIRTGVNKDGILKYIQGSHHIPATYVMARSDSYQGYRDLFDKKAREMSGKIPGPQILEAIKLLAGMKGRENLSRRRWSWKALKLLVDFEMARDRRRENLLRRRWSWKAFKLLVEFEMARDRLRKAFKHPIVFLGDNGGCRQNQIRWHLDTYMATAPRSLVLLQDHLENLWVLSKHLKSGHLTYAENEVFRSYYRTSRYLQAREEEQLNKDEKQLREEGFYPVRVPGVYLCGKDEHINYLNGLYFYSAQDKATIGLANGSPTPGEFKLRSAFVQAVRAAGVARVYFCARAVTEVDLFDGGCFNYAEAYRRIRDNGSLHCSVLDVRKYQVVAPAPKVITNSGSDEKGNHQTSAHPKADSKSVSNKKENHEAPVPAKGQKTGRRPDRTPLVTRDTNSGSDRNDNHRVAASRKAERKGHSPRRAAGSHLQRS